MSHAVKVTSASFIIRDKESKQVVCETFNHSLLPHLNYTKYEAVPILEYLQELNREIKTKNI